MWAIVLGSMCPPSERVETAASVSRLSAQLQCHPFVHIRPIVDLSSSSLSSIFQVGTDPSNLHSGTYIHTLLTPSLTLLCCNLCPKLNITIINNISRKDQNQLLYDKVASKTSNVNSKNSLNQMRLKIVIQTNGLLCCGRTDGRMEGRSFIICPWLKFLFDAQSWSVECPFVRQSIIITKLFQLKLNTMAHCVVQSKVDLQMVNYTQSSSRYAALQSQTFIFISAAAAPVHSTSYPDETIQSSPHPPSLYYIIRTTTACTAFPRYKRRRHAPQSVMQGISSKTRK